MNYKSRHLFSSKYRKYKFWETIGGTNTGNKAVSDEELKQD